MLAAILESGEDVEGILLERAQALPDAELLLSERRIRERCTLLAGSFFDPIEAAADRWILSQVLHDWPDAACQSILRRCRERMQASDRLLIVEMVPVPSRPDAEIAILDIAMMTFGGEARQRTLDEYHALFAATGFEPTRAMPTASKFSIVEARPA